MTVNEFDQRKDKVKRNPCFLSRASDGIRHRVQTEMAKVQQKHLGTEVEQRQLRALSGLQLKTNNNLARRHANIHVADWHDLQCIYWWISMLSNRTCQANEDYINTCSAPKTLLGYVATFTHCAARVPTQVVWESCALTAAYGNGGQRHDFM